MRFGSTSITVTGTVSPASVKMRVMPALRPIRATLMTVLSFVAHAHAYAVRVALQLAPRGVASRTRHRSAQPLPDGGLRSSSGLGCRRSGSNLARFRWKSIAWVQTLRAGPRRKGAQYMHGLRKPQHRAGPADGGSGTTFRKAFPIKRLCKTGVVPGRAYICVSPARDRR